MKITIITLFPEMFESVFASSIVHRSLRQEALEIEFVQLRDFALDRYKHVDDKPFGGGAGMVLKCQPVLDALETVQTPQSHTVLFAASGHVYTQQKARSFAQKDHLILLCGHYEGLDARIEDHVDECLSIGDYVLTGGEVAAMVVVDSIARLLPGVIKSESTTFESHENGLLEYPQYTQPADYKGAKVPDVLLSGNHAKIAQWRKVQSLVKTRALRPDLFARYTLSKEEKKWLEAYDAENG